MTSPLNVAIIGMGTVGGGVAQILTEHSERCARRSGRSIHIAKAVVRDLSKPRGIDLPDGVLTDDVQSVIDDPNIDVAIQLMGGTDPARQVMLSLLEAGKDVVTANKALLCDHGPELFEKARELGRCIAFEAAVAGGIPIIEAVSQSMSGNQITSIQAILNGTCNYILTEMLKRSASYGDILSEAQELGYAEADPAMDVEGTDAAQKLVILCQLAFGKRVSLSDFPTQGIDSLELADLKYAAELGYRIKLLAVAQLVGDSLELHVEPKLVHSDEPIAKTDGPLNIVALNGDAVGPTWYAGAGAGKMPTASAVVADLMDVVIGRAQLTFPLMSVWGDTGPQVRPPEEITRRYYLRFNVDDRPHVLADITDILGRNEISIASVIQHEAPEATGGETRSVPLVIMTHTTTEGRIRMADSELSQLDSIKAPRIRLPVLD
ncbi:MAG: homoserine dehydrogenase [Planctomycetaceae bacterium]|nr:homoserine dehydrogenase [Planctomycetaceae bacterium]